MIRRRLVGLYPGAWRRRYEDEFLAVLEARPLRAGDVADVVRGSIDARLLDYLHGGSAGMLSRFAGLCAILAGVALCLTFIPSQVYFEGLGTAAMIGFHVFYPLAFFGSLGIHLKLTRVRPNLAWPAWVAAVLGGLVGSSSVVMSMWGGGIPASDFGLFQAIGLWIGSAALGAAIVVIRAIPPVVGLAFLVGSALAMIGPVAGDALQRFEILTVLSRSGVVIYAVGWIVAGLSLQFAGSEPETLGRLEGGAA